MAVEKPHDMMVTELRSAGYLLLEPTSASAGLELYLGALDKLVPSWDRLPRDAYLRDGGHYRARRHSCFHFSAATSTLTAVPPRPHWQPTTYNALHGGMLRWFEPIEPHVADDSTFRRLLSSLGALFAQLQPTERWYVEAHQFRIDTSRGIGRPTPEGAHRDGVDFVAVVLVKRWAIRGGETRVFQAQGNRGVRFTMKQPWSMLLMDDARVIHETTPIQSEAVGELSADAPGTSQSPAGGRDTLVLTYRASGFQEPAAAGG